MSPEAELQNDADVWESDNLTVNDDGYVEGNAHTFESGGHTITASVSSYCYERNGVERMNHVPNVVIEAENGAIVTEVDANDSEDAELAIENAKGAAEFAFNNIEDFV